jgi:6-phosphogluconolactonase
MESREKLEERLAARISGLLEAEIEANGVASMLVSGGGTPKGLFRRLSEISIEWDKVQISLVDERFLPDGDENQNGTMVKELLLQNAAAASSFIPFVYSDALDKNLKILRTAVDVLTQPFTIVVLGVGGDGHTASIFPDSEELKEALNPKNPDSIMITRSKSLPHARFTFTAQALLNSKQFIVHCYGEQKKEILKAASKQTSALPFPIAFFINQETVPVETYWTQ